MNREDIVELGRKAGFSKHEGIITGGVSDLERFAALVAAAAKAEENEACAKVCEDQMNKWPFGVREQVCAKAIRVRSGETK